MLPTIGLMIGCYILLRCLSFFTRTGERREDVIVRVASVIVFFLTILFMWMLYDVAASGDEVVNDFLQYMQEANP